MKAVRSVLPLGGQKRHEGVDLLIPNSQSLEEERLLHIFRSGEAQTSVVLIAQSACKAPKNPAKRVFLVPKITTKWSLTTSP